MSLIHLLVIFTNIIENVIPQQNCGASIQIVTCGTYSRIQPISLVSKFDRGKCPAESLKYMWEIIEMDHEGNFKDTVIYEDNYEHSTLFINPFQLETGHYGVILYSKKYNSKAKKYLPYEPGNCELIIRPESPIPKISGGSRIVPSGKEFLVDGSESMNMDMPYGRQEKSLYYQWKCEVKDEPNHEFCSKNLGTKPSVIVPAEYSLIGKEFNFELSVKTKDVSWQTTTATIEVQANAVSVSISCKKNCQPIFPITSIKYPLILKAMCSECGKISFDSYEWFVENNFDFGSNTKHGKNSQILYVYPDTLSPGKTYEIKVKLRGAFTGAASIVIKTGTFPKIQSCSANPTVGDALKTKFQVSCQVDSDHEHIFELFSRNGDKDVFLAKGPNLDELSVVLPPKSKIFIKILDVYNSFDTTVLDVDVRPVLDSSGRSEEIKKQIEEMFFNKNSPYSINQGLKSLDYEEVLGIINVLSDEVAQLGDEKVQLTTDYHKKMLHLLDELTKYLTKEDTIQAASISDKIVSNYKSKSDPEIATVGSEICRKAASKMVQGIADTYFPQLMAHKVEENVHMLASCSESVLTPNPELFEQQLNLTTPYPNLDIPVIQENYPDYPERSDDIDNYKIATENMIEICYLNSKSMLALMVPEEDPKVISSEYLNVTVTRKFGKDAFSTATKSGGVEVSSSKDFAHFTEGIVDILMCTTDKDPYWYLNREKIHSDVAFLKFKLNGKDIDRFSLPYHLTFDLNSDVPGSKNVHGDTPLESQSVIEEHRYNEMISFYRIEVFSGESFTVEFNNLSSGDEFDTMVTIFEKPSYKKFIKFSTKVNAQNSVIYKKHDRKFDAWYYLSVLAHPYSTSKKHFVFSVYSKSCYFWNSNSEDWEYACGSGKNTKERKISCDCLHTSWLASRKSDKKIIFERPIDEVLVLEFQLNYTVFLVLLISYLIFCIILVYLSRPKNEEFLDKVYFLGDVPISYKNAYLVVIKTGDERYSGTTSNISIKIFGSESESKEHVLNYPDPQQLILQRSSEDWFVLATENNLGEILKIEIWFDAIGESPSWFCYQIEIYDLQVDKHWNFVIDSWLDVTRSNTYFSVEANKYENSINKEYFKGHHMWNIKHEDQQISKIMRLTIIYSIFLSTFAFLLFFFHRPILRNTDSLAYSGSLPTLVTWTTIVTFLLVFLIHFPIVCALKMKINHWTRAQNIVWGILIFFVVLFTTLLVVFGFWIPTSIVYFWLLAVTLSLLIYALILENLAKIIFNIIFKMKTAADLVVRNVKKILPYIEVLRLELYKKFGKVLLRPYFHHLYYYLDEYKLEKRREWEETKKKITELLQDISMIVCYVTLLYLIILADRSYDLFISNMHMKGMLMGSHSRVMRATDRLNSIPMVKYYINNSFIPTMQNTQWYGRYVSNNPGMMNDFSNKYLGVARIVQQRTTEDCCRVSKYMHFTNMYCNPEFFDFYCPEYRTFGQNWTINANKGSLYRRIWKYTWNVGRIPYFGHFGYYSADGYIGPLGRTYKNSLINFRYYHKHNWINRMSRVVLIEFLTYNPNSNIFNAVEVVFEIGASGYVAKAFNVKTAKLLYVDDDLAVSKLMLIIAFNIVLIIFLMRRLWMIYKTKKMFFKDLWHILDLAIIILSITCVVMYFHRAEMINIFLKKLEGVRHNQFVNYYNLFHAEVFLITLAAFLVFIATVRLWKLLRFLVVFRLVEKTLKDATPFILGIFFCQCIIILAFALVGVLLFGDESKYFKTTQDSIMSLLLIPLGMLPNFDLDSLHTFLETLYYVAYNVISLLLITIYIAIITIYYGQARIYYSNEQNYSVKYYLKEKSKYYFTLAKIRFMSYRLKGGEDFNEYKAVIPKSDEHRYDKCLTIPKSRMKSMVYITKCVLRNLKQHQGVSDKDVQLITMTLNNLNQAESLDNYLFFVGNNGYRLKVVDDWRLMEMEDIVEDMFDEDGKRKEERTNKRKEFYKALINGRNERLGRIVRNLNNVSRVLDNIKIDVK